MKPILGAPSRTKCSAGVTAVRRAATYHSSLAATTKDAAYPSSLQRQHAQRQRLRVAGANNTKNESPERLRRLLPPFGHRLVDYFEPRDARIHVSRAAAPVFDLYNAKYVPEILRPALENPTEEDTRKTLPLPRERRQQTIKVDGLEKVAVLALRLDHLRAGKCSADEVRRLARELFLSVSEHETHYFFHDDIDAQILEAYDAELPQKPPADMSTDDILAQLLAAPIPKSADHHRQSRILRLLEREGYSKEDLARWMDCIRARTLADAVQAMEGAPDHQQSHEPRRWPKFLLLFTLRRHCESRLEALELFRLYVQYFPTLDKTSQTKFLFRVLQRAQQWVPDVLPDVCHTFVAHAQTDLLASEFVCNQVLWTLSTFGRAYTTTATVLQSTAGEDHYTIFSRDNELALQAQQIVATKMRDAGVPIDTKGYLALAHALHTVSPERARALVDIVKQHRYPVSAAEQAALTDANLSTDTSSDDGVRRRQHRAGVFPYLQGLTCMEILLSRTGEDALAAFDRGVGHAQWRELEAAAGYRYAASSGLWAVLLLRLRQLHELPPAAAEVFWRKIVQHKVNLSPFLLMQVVAGLAGGGGGSHSSVDRDGEFVESSAARFAQLLGVDPQPENQHGENYYESDEDRRARAAERRLLLAQDILLRQNPGFLSESLTAAYIRVLNRGDSLTISTLNHNGSSSDMQAAGYVARGPSSATHASGMARAREMLANMEGRASLACYNALMAGEARHAPAALWTTYCALLGAGHEPDAATLYHLCRAAWNPRLAWTDPAGHGDRDGGNSEPPLTLYAAQRMVVEFKHWVRGAHLDRGDAGDLLKLYPTQRLVFAYAVMLGKAGYGDELLGLLPWLDRVGLAPDKQTLCALVTYSPNGAYLMRHGQAANASRAAGTSGAEPDIAAARARIVWPTPMEVQTFQNAIRKV